MKFLARSIVATFAVLVVSCHAVDPVENDSDVSTPEVSNASIRKAHFQEQWCSFDLSEEGVENYFLVAEEVSAHEFNADAIIAPCHYEGTITLDGVDSQWKLYAGGAAYLYSVDKSLEKRYLCKEPCRDILPALK